RQRAQREGQGEGEGAGAPARFADRGRPLAEPLSDARAEVWGTRRPGSLVRGGRSQSGHGAGKRASGEHGATPYLGRGAAAGGEARGAVGFRDRDLVRWGQR